MKKTLSRLVIAALLASPLVAVAGYKGKWFVGIDTVHRHATGAIGSARNSLDSVQYIGCGVTSSVGSPRSGICIARDQNGNMASCWSEDPGVLEALTSLSTDSYVEFHWDDLGSCTTIHLAVLSHLEPKK